MCVCVHLYAMRDDDDGIVGVPRCERVRARLASENGHEIIERAPPYIEK